MHGPMRLVRASDIPGYKNKGPLCEHADGMSYLIIDEVEFKGKRGAVLYYHNPPVHQVGTPMLYAYHAGLDEILLRRDTLDFLVLYGANDPVHTGGDLKESFRNMKETLSKKEEMAAQGASDGELWDLFNWADERLRKGVILYGKLRKAAQHLRLVGVCGGGPRYGGSAEISLMADVLVGDSRSGMCFSEAMIGIIPGWAGVGRVLTKAGFVNAEYMAKTGRVVPATDLKRAGIFNDVVPVPFAFPRMKKTGDPQADKSAYARELEAHDQETGKLLFPAGLKYAVAPSDEIPGQDGKEPGELATQQAVLSEVELRRAPENYSRLWGVPLREADKKLEAIGRPLAPQSIEALDRLLSTYVKGAFDEDAFVEEELQADAALYRDPRFPEGLTAVIERRVPDFRMP